MKTLFLIFTKCVDMANKTTLNQEAWVQAQGLSVTSCMTLGKLSLCALVFTLANRDKTSTTL